MSKYNTIDRKIKVHHVRHAGNLSQLEEAIDKCISEIKKLHGDLYEITDIQITGGVENGCGHTAFIIYTVPNSWEDSDGPA